MLFREIPHVAHRRGLAERTGVAPSYDGCRSTHLRWKRRRFGAGGDTGIREARVESGAEWVAVDWGTSNLRAWGIAPDGEIAFARSSDRGMGKLAPDAFPDVLTELLAADVDTAGTRIDVVICGMAGARQGWMEAPYIEAPADLGGLAYGAVRPPMPRSRLEPRILPGVCQKLGGAEDVMRGEETQLLGLGSLTPGFSGVVVLPGTHSKWVDLSGRRIERFSTSMTGEI